VSSASGSKDAPLVSVIIAAYNAAAYIGETCASVLNQTYRSLELIVVDDGSTDETATIVQTLADADSRVRLIRQQNLGVAAARNCAIEAAGGEFIAPLDADDLWEPTKIERQVRRMQECGPDTGMVYAWWAWIDLDNNVMDRSPRWHVEGRVLERLVEVNFTGNASVPMYRRSCLLEVGGYSTGMRERGSHGCEDWDLAIRVAERYAVGVVQAVLVGYRRRNDSMSTECDTMWRSQQEIIAAIAARQPSVSRKIVRQSNGQFALYLSGVSFWSGQYLQAIRWALRARPLSLLLSVLPYVIPVIRRRFFEASQPPTKFGTLHERADEASFRDPLVPYARIYARHWHELHPGTLLESPVFQFAAVMVAVVLSALYHWQNDGLWLQGDSPRHAATGLFLLDLLRELPAHPLDFALSYYARYPLIVPMVYPPLFHLLEAGAFAVLAPTPFVAKGLVLAFAVVGGVYVALWGRRRIAPIAGWAGAVVVLMPAIVRYSNGVLLNVPATALGLGALFHLQEWLSTESRRHRTLFLLLSLATVLTYYPGAIIIPIAMVWMVFSRRLLGARSAVVWITVAVALGLIAFAVLAFPTFSSRNAPQLTRLFHSAAWWFYFRRLPLVVDPVWLGLGTIGLAAGLATPHRRQHAAQLALVYPIVFVCLVLLPAYSDRYALLLAPITVLAAFLGLAIGLDSARRWRTVMAAGVLTAILVWSGGSGLKARVPEVAGFRPIAEYLRANGPQDAVLYSGRYDGVFGFYMQALDPRFNRRLMLTNRLLYGYGQDSNFNYVETPHVGSPADVVAAIRQQSGCRWVAIEIAPESELPVSDRYLRQALEGPEFERVQSFPITAGPVSRVDLYRVRAPVAPAPPMDLRFPSFSDRVFRSVQPIATRP
jgi:hypothetical protein